MSGGRIKRLHELFYKYVGGRPDRHLVGSDRHGNKYFREFKPGRPEVDHKRYYEPRGMEKMTSAHDLIDEYIDNPLPPEWKMWLNGARLHPPCPEEEEAIVGFQEKVAANVAELDRLDRLKDDPPALDVGDISGSVTPLEVQIDQRMGRERAEEGRSEGGDFLPGSWKKS